MFITIHKSPCHLFPAEEIWGRPTKLMSLLNIYKFLTGSDNRIHGLLRPVSTQENNPGIGPDRNKI